VKRLEQAIAGHGSCRFCKILKSADQSVHDAVDLPWMQDSRYAAIVSIGALVPGWSLVCPRAHQLNLSSHFERADFWEFCSRAEGQLASRFGHVRVFEHGAQFEQSATGCGTDHAHLHLVPLDFGLCEAVLQSPGDLSWTRCRLSDVRRLAAGREYLFAADKLDGSETQGILAFPPVPTSQFFRRVIADRLGMSAMYDYKRFPMTDVAAESARVLMADVQEAQESAVGA